MRTAFAVQETCLDKVQYREATNQLLVNSWFGLVVLGIPLSNNPFHKGMLGIQTTNQANN